MSEIEVSAEEVDALAGKLDALSGSLTENEQALLLAVFRIAGSAIGEKVGGDVEGFAAAGNPSFRLNRQAQLAPLSQGFRGAFAQGSVGGINPAADISVDGSVSVMGTSMNFGGFEF